MKDFGLLLMFSSLFRALLPNGISFLLYYNISELGIQSRAAAHVKTRCSAHFLKRDFVRRGLRRAAAHLGTLQRVGHIPGPFWRAAAPLGHAAARVQPLGTFWARCSPSSALQRAFLELGRFWCAAAHFSALQPAPPLLSGLLCIPLHAVAQNGALQPAFLHSKPPLLCFKILFCLLLPLIHKLGKYSSLLHAK